MLTKDEFTIESERIGKNLIQDVIDKANEKIHALVAENSNPDVNEEELEQDLVEHTLDFIRDNI